MRAAIALVLATAVATQAQTPSDTARYKAEAARVTITRDDWGIAHIHGRTDADAVFGMIYAQCEDDFNRVETNYLTSLGRTAEAEGESAIWQDLRQRLFIDPEDPEAGLRRQPRMAPQAHGRLGRRHQLLPRHPPRPPTPKSSPTSNPGWPSPSPKAPSAATSRGSTSAARGSSKPSSSTRF